MPYFDLRDPFLVLLLVILGVLVTLLAVFGLVALWLRRNNVRKAALWASLEVRWQPRLLEVLYGGAAPETLWDTVEPGRDLYFVSYLLRYARRLAGEERDLICALARPFLNRVPAQTLSRDPERRARAVQTLGTLGLPEYERLVLDALADPSPLVAMSAARSLAHAGEARYTPALLRQLHRFDRWRSGFLAAMLASIGPAAGGALRDALGNPAMPAGTRATAAAALGQLNDIQAAEAAYRVVREEEDEDLVASCMRLLARVGRPEHLPEIRAKLNSERFAVRAAAARALGSLGTTTETDILRAAMLNDESRWVAMSAARSLIVIGGEALLSTLAASDHERASLAVQVLREGRRA